MATAISFCLLVVLGIALAQTCPGVPNLNTPDASPLQLMNQITNGKLYQAGSGDDAISLLHIWGNTPEEFGTAYGTLMGPVIATTLTAMYQDIETQVMQSLDKIPEDMRDFVAKYGLAAALDLTRDLTKPWWPWYFEPEMLALSEAASVDFDMVVRIHMLPELVQAGCSMFGAWGKATPTGNLLQLRSLDWAMEYGLQNHPVVAVYHPTNASLGHAFANVNWAGFLGGLTGFSSAHVGLSEKHGDNNTLEYTSRMGIPFHFLLRDILQWDVTLDDAINRMENAKRTCSIYVGVGTAADGQFRVFNYNARNVEVYDPTTQPYGPHLEDVVYRTVDQTCFSNQLQALWGNLTAQNAMRDIMSIAETGNLHLAVYDFGAQQMYVANAAAANETGPINAFDRQFVQFDLQSLWAEQPPTSDELLAWSKNH